MTKLIGSSVGEPDRRRISPLVERIPHQPKARRLRVIRVVELSPQMVRIVLGGDALEAEFPFLRLACTDHVKLVPPDPATGDVELPEPGRGSVHGPDGSAPVMRDYTVRGFDRGARELTLDFVLHDHGPVGRWAIGAVPGDQIGVLGPRGSQVFPVDVSGYLLIADPTGIPAVERFLEELPGDLEVQVIALDVEPTERRVLGGGRATGVHWCAGHEASIVAVMSQLSLSAGTFVWAAGEAGAMRAVRHMLLDTMGLPAEHVDIHGYWRAGDSDS